MDRPLAIVKVGGSLYDLPDLATRLQVWLSAEENSRFRILLVPGGGLTADAIRTLDRHHRLGEEKSHWLALRALSLNAHFLASLLPSARVIGDGRACQHIWSENRIPILDPHEFARADEGRAGHLPHCWAVTSDALAARAAVVYDAAHLILLKSVTLPPGIDWHEAAQRGHVDALFAEVLRGAPEYLRVSSVNLRTWPD